MENLYPNWLWTWKRQSPKDNSDLLVRSPRKTKTTGRLVRRSLFVLMGKKAGQIFWVKVGPADKLLKVSPLGNLRFSEIFYYGSNRISAENKKRKTQTIVWEFAELLSKLERKASSLPTDAGRFFGLFPAVSGGFLSGKGGLRRLYFR